MSIKEFLYKVCNKIDPIKSILRRRMISHLKNNLARKSLNNKYNHMSIAEQAAYHTLYATSLDNSTIDEFIWNVYFLGKNIKMPISKANGGLEWNTALSILGHGKSIKQFYSKLLLSHSKPKVFFDVGSNYGTHSLLFLKHGVKTFSFEPNENCHPLFEKLCTLNNVQPSLVSKALSDKESTAELYFPNDETWLGTIEQRIKSNLAENHELVSHLVMTIRLDEFCKSTNVYPDLIKIDTEGHELSVLYGSSATLNEHKPIVLFECNQKDKKEAIYSFFNDQNYNIFGLPYSMKPLESLVDFETNLNTDFVAINRAVKLEF